MASVKQPFISGGIIMNIWENAVLTDKGTALQAKLIQGQTLKISRVTTGSKKVPIVDLRQQTDVTEGGYDITLQPSRTEGEKTILPVLLENTSLKESYDLWQVGFFAEDPEEGEILYCLAQASEARHIPSATEGPGFSITWDFVIKTSNTTPFEVDLDSVGLVSIEQYQVHTGEIHSLKNSIVNLDRKFEDLNSALYPVGIVVAFVNGFNPNESLQGEWERIAKGRTLVGVNEADPDFNTAEQSGGLKDVTLSINQIPAHSHQESDLSYVYTDEHPANNSIVTTNQNGRQNINMNINSKTYTKNAGEGGSHSNLQPYFTVFYWVRRK